VKNPKKMPEFILIALVCLMIGYGTGAVLTERKKMVTLENSVALKWSDGISNGPPLGAHVYLEPHMNGKSVRLRVYIGRERPEFFMPERKRNGEIDVVDDAQRASRKWSNIHWRSDGLHVGVDGNRTRLIVPYEIIKPIR
jgi:hypothetical protein|tara:strand:+ start:315 stop:734 length:420 start_codon:yes stop_codon:yes gene_type:complete